MIVKLAFKKDCNGIIGRLIKWWTKSRYCHVEILLPGRDGKYEPGVWVSANGRKGVRMKPIIWPLDHTRWDYIDVEVPDENYDNVIKRLNEIIKFKYATKDLILVQMLKLDKMESRKRAFCSETVCEILRAFKEPKIMKLDTPCVNFSPEDLYRLYL
jgi:hypothetical protein